MQQIAPAALVYVWLLTEWVVFMWLKWFHCSLSVSIWPVFFSGISARLACQHPSYPSSHLHLIRVTKCASVFFSVVLTSKACSCLLRWPPPFFFKPVQLREEEHYGFVLPLLLLGFEKWLSTCPMYMQSFTLPDTVSIFICRKQETSITLLYLEIEV